MASNVTNGKKKNTGRKGSGRPAGSTKRTSTKTGSRSAQGQSSKSSLHGDIALIAAFCITVLLYLANFGLCGPFGKVLTNLTFGLFGFVGYITPALVMLAVCFLVSNKNKANIIKKIVLSVFFVALTCAIVSVLTLQGLTADTKISELYDVSMGGKTGGIVGNYIAFLCCPKFGKVATFIILFAIWVVFFLAITDFSLVDWIKYRVELWRDSSQHSREIRDIKHEHMQMKREEKLE
nr:DNA translocase FtsK 4TM domain-containing protein [Lachnospiraceae bacterium]